VIADPWTITPVTVVPGVDLTLVYDEVAEREVTKIWAERKNITKWLVGEKRDVSKGRQKVK